MIKNNRGMSEIITTLIIIALALIALGVVWYVVNNVLSSSKAEVEAGVENIFQTCDEAGGTVTDEATACDTGETKQIIGGQYCCVPA